ncbi:hypothetical protein PV08_09863 [Exophiala spinifera]|uniref:Uncharacterized protein n=1 Tax=Exophiala spinifera TaxID=91928 RepID=A0A0D2B1W0_9EURO|nr:uncharacterized protein PV08_09863 [Exophiala spinifera]KIW12585.1 hypothetical protein PV08_09863 [Exophiala spinifera]
MDPLSLTTSILSILCLSVTVVQYINDVKDSQKDRIRLRDEITSASGPLYMLCDRIKQEQARMSGGPDVSGTTWMSCVMELGTPKGPLEQYEEVLRELERRLALPKGRERSVANLGRLLAWPFQRSDIERYVLVIERKKSLFQLALQNDNMYVADLEFTQPRQIADGFSRTLTQAIKNDTKLIHEIAREVAEIAVKIGKITANDNVRETRAIINWLSPLDFSRVQDSIFARRTPGTGLWFLGSPMYQSWIDSAGGTMWCPGIPGAGKTLMSSIVVNDLRDRFDAVPGVGIAAIYCNYKERLEQTAVNLLSGLWLQLAQGSGQLSDDVKSLYRKHVDRNTLPTLAEVEMVVSKEVGRYQKVFVVVDALDECHWSLRMDLLETLQTLQPKVNLLVTSRFDDSIAHSFEESSTYEIEARTEDLLIYISSRISGQLTRHVKRDPSLAGEIEKVVVERAKNMFLLARLQLDSLQEKCTPKAVRKALAMLPNDLDGMYDETLLRIENQSKDYKELALQILEWIVFAVRPLTVNELQIALAVENGTQEIDESNFVDPELLTSVCAGLVILDQASSVIRLVHYSTQEYFRRMRLSRFANAQFHIGSTCLTYLSFREFADGACSNDRAGRVRMRKHRLLHYAAQHWGDHCRDDSERELKTQIFQFIDNEAQVSSAVQVMHLTAPTRFPEIMSRLHLAAHFGLEETVETLLQNGDSVSARDGFGATALHRAAETGQKNVVKRLLEQGADIESRDSKGHRAIHRATIGGRTETVLFLLDKGANVSEAIDGRTALHFAAETGNKEIITALVKAGGEVDTVSYNVGENNWQKKFFAGRTPLHWAAQNGHLVVAQVLVEHGARVNALNSTNRTPLQEAIMFSHVHMVRYLLEEGASVTTEDDCGWTPLHEAAWQATPEIAKMLIEHGAYIDSTNIDTPADAKLPGVEVSIGEDGCKPFHLATYIQLIDQGTEEIDNATVDSPQDRKVPEFRLNMGQVGCTPLHLAAIRGEFELFELLKLHGANIEFCDSSGLTPLHRTVQAERSDGTLQIIKSLLDAGAEIDVRDKRRQETTLQMASRLGRVDRIEYLLQRGANPEAINRFGENSLQLAEAAGHAEAARLILEYQTRP